MKKHYQDLTFNQQTNALAGSELSLEAIETLLNTTDLNKDQLSQAELDVLNHSNAIHYLYDLLEVKAPLTESIIKDFNFLLLKDSAEERFAGNYRNRCVLLPATGKIPTQPYLLAPMMENLISEYQQNIDNASDKIALIAKFHSDIIAIHPFSDQNRRTARLVMNYELLKYGYPWAIIRKEDKAAYEEALNQGEQHQYAAIEKLIKSRL